MPAPLANVITLGALDLPRLRAFYGALGWPQVIDEEDFAAFELRGAVLALFPRAKLGADGRVEPSTDVGCRFTIGLMTDTRDEIDAVVDRMRARRQPGRCGGEACVGWRCRVLMRLLDDPRSLPASRPPPSPRAPAFDGLERETWQLGRRG